MFCHLSSAESLAGLLPVSPPPNPNPCPLQPEDANSVTFGSFAAGQASQGGNPEKSLTAPRPAGLPAKWCVSPDSALGTAWLCLEVGNHPGAAVFKVTPEE